MKPRKKQPLPKSCCVVACLLGEGYRGPDKFWDDDVVTFMHGKKVFTNEGDGVLDAAFDEVTDGCASSLWDDVYCESCADRIARDLNGRLGKLGYRFFARNANDGSTLVDDITEMEMCENCGDYLSSYIKQGLYIETYGELQKWERKCLADAGRSWPPPKTLAFQNFGRTETGRIVTHWNYGGLWSDYVVYARNPYGNHNLVYVSGSYTIRHGNVAVVDRVLRHAPRHVCQKVVNFLFKRGKRIDKAFEPPRDGSMDGRFHVGEWERYQIKKALCKRYELPEPPEPRYDDVPF